MAKGKRNTVVVTAIAREIAAFLWAIARHIAPLPAEPGSAPDLCCTDAVS